GSDVKEMLRVSAIASSIEQVGYVPHQESVRQLLLADMLLLVVDESKDSRAIVPGKVFEYLGARRPILALTDPEGAAAAIVRDTGSGTVVANQDVDGIRRAFVECYRNFVYHVSGPPSNGEAVRAYERREVTRRLAELLAYVVQRR
ncbi:MAG: glycosyl transferase family 1, partial [Bacteroidota bacterium]